MILVDSSCWIDYLRAADTAARFEVRRLLHTTPDSVQLADPISMELLAGARGHELTTVERLVNGLPSLACDSAEDFRTAAGLHRAVRENGETVRKLLDCLIAAIALRNDVELVHKDADFEAIARVAPLRSRSLR